MGRVKGVLRAEQRPGFPSPLPEPNPPAPRRRHGMRSKPQTVRVNRPYLNSAGRFCFCCSGRRVACIATLVFAAGRLPLQKHSRADLFGIMKREHDIRPATAQENSIGNNLSVLCVKPI